MLLSIVIDGKRIDNSAIDLLIKELLQIPALSKNARDNCVDRNISCDNQIDKKWFLIEKYMNKK